MSPMMCPAELVTALTAAAIALAEGRSAEDTSWLGVMLVHLGETLTTLAFQQSLLEQQNGTRSLESDISSGAF